ncbi:MAG: SagB/ThcOx family dehydrogenase [Candidatus Omnitrophota bacterium]|nr:SagB/ThcOx family dehydrogenase [Candidatus Omnitrophota bacterium]
MKNSYHFIILFFICSIIFFNARDYAYAKKNPYVGERFHHDTELKRGEAINEWSSLFKGQKLSPIEYKTYPDTQKIKLPDSEFIGMPVEEAIEKRRSARVFSGEPLTLPELSRLLYSAAGITARYGDFQLRAVPSHGASYPIEIYTLIKNVSGVTPGLYHYLPQEHSLELIKEGDVGIDFICIKPINLTKAAVIFFLTAVPERITSQFDIRGYRYIYTEAGHISQNLYLQATSLGLGSVAIGSFYDNEVNSLLGLDGRNEFAVYAHVAGRAAVVEAGGN